MRKFGKSASKLMFKFRHKFLIATAILILFLICLLYKLILRNEEIDSRYIINTAELKRATESVPLEKGQKIPKIIHQSWKTKVLPAKFRQWSDSWSLKNPTYVRKLWTDEDNRALISEHYPWFLEKFDSFPQNIHRIDVSRIFYMHRYGGVYSDLDVVCLKSLDELLGTHDLVLARMGEDDEYEHSIPNAWFASKPGHDFWMLFAHMVLELKDYDGSRDNAETIAGPVMLFNVLKEYQERLSKQKKSKHEGDLDNLYVAPKEYIFPYSWHGEPHPMCSANSGSVFNETLCQEVVNPEKKAFAITYWAHSWGGGFQGN